jgi:hypothetical protein
VTLIPTNATLSRNTLAIREERRKEREREREREKESSRVALLRVSRIDSWEDGKES